MHWSDPFECNVERRQIVGEDGLQVGPSDAGPIQRVWLNPEAVLWISLQPIEHRFSVDTLRRGFHSASTNWPYTGYRWTDVVEADQVAQTPGGEVTIPMRMAYSGDAPRVEIIQTARARFGFRRTRVCTTWVTGPTMSNRIWRHWNPAACAMRRNRTTRTARARCCGRTARGRLDHASNWSAGRWNRSSNIGGRRPRQLLLRPWRPA